MLEQINQELKHGSTATIVPISFLPRIKQDVEDLKGSGVLNNFQKYIVNKFYGLDLPDHDFEISSIVIIASPSPALARITFTWKGKRIPLLLPGFYLEKETAPIRIENYLNEYLNPLGHHVKYAPTLPRKLLAARSGLGVYGRNNICYVKGMGSFLYLSVYYSSIPSPEANWHSIKQMDLCENCNACLNNCPTGAITKERFLINNERCLTYYNKGGGDRDFPEWIHSSAHNSIYGCTRCQTVCPINREYLNNITEPAEFTEEETRLLLEGTPLEQFSQKLKEKVNELDMIDYLGVLPRNLKILLAENV